MASATLPPASLGCSALQWVQPALGASVSPDLLPAHLESNQALQECVCEEDDFQHGCFQNKQLSFPAQGWVLSLMLLLFSQGCCRGNLTSSHALVTWQHSVPAEGFGLMSPVNWERFSFHQKWLWAELSCVLRHCTVWTSRTGARLITVQQAGERIAQVYKLITGVLTTPGWFHFTAEQLQSSVYRKLYINSPRKSSLP